jgi:cobalamin biosynthetic protein CobC
MNHTRDHGGGLDAAVKTYGGERLDWLDLSTGINPVPYPIGEISNDAWTALPDQNAMDDLLGAARKFWNVPDNAAIIAAPGASALIARMPDIAQRGGAYIPTPTYNEHAAAFNVRQPMMDQTDPSHPTHIYVHPNNPDGHLWSKDEIGKARLRVIDESFCDVMPDHSHIKLSQKDGTIVLKSFGKFWGLAGMRLGFAIGTEVTLAPSGPSMQDYLGPWAVAGPALTIGTRALSDDIWANGTRTRLAQDAARLDGLVTAKGGQLVGGTTLFRLYEVDDAAEWQSRLAQSHIWSRIFPYSKTWLRLGLPHPDRWTQLEAAL